MLIGSLFTRELVLAPRRPRTYIARVVYGLMLLVLTSTAWLVLTGTQLIRDVGDMARFGMILFQMLAPLQLAIALFFSALLSASGVAQEKDRKTLVLLLLTKLSNSELVLGKLFASLLGVLMLLATALPIFMLCALFGGVSFAQIGRAFAVTLAGAVACGSLGSTLAFWREKTFQSLALAVLVLVLWLAAGEIVASGALGSGWWGLSHETWAIALSPWQAILEATRPYVPADPTLGPLGTPVNLFLIVSVAMAAALNGLSIALLRVWNPSREARTAIREDETWNRTSVREAATLAEPVAHSEEPVAPKCNPNVVGTRRVPYSADGTRSVPTTISPSCSFTGDRPPARTRQVWDNPILWREIATWAYGRKMLVIRLVYLAGFAAAAGSIVWMAHHGQTITRAGGATALVPLFLLSFVLINAQAVTALTSERDAKALDLLLVTDLTPKEIVWGKLGGVFYNTKEMVLLPMLLCGYLSYVHALSFENLLYLCGGLAVLYGFSAMVGIHAGMNYFNSKSAIATSLGTVFFLFLGVATCMRMMVAFSGSFQAQLQPFLAFMIGGGLGLYVALGARNPSTAIAAASFLCPLATFYAITSFFLDYTLAVFLVTAGAYGFATAAMLIPAIYEFDVATGRTTIE